MPEAPMLNLRRGYRAVEGLRQDMGFAGYFTVELVHISSGLIARSLKFKNLITNVAMDSFATTNYGFYPYCAVGTGSTPPAFTDTALESELARTASAGGFADVNTGSVGAGYIGKKITRVFTSAEANGVLTEVGMFSASTAGDMLCRQLLVDDAGNPTSITKTSDYELRISYELQLHISLADYVYSAVVNGVAQDVTRRPGGGWSHAHLNATVTAFVWFAVDGFGNVSYDSTGAFTGTLGAAGGKPSGTGALPTIKIEDDYVAGTYSRGIAFEWGASVANQSNLTFATAISTHRSNRTQLWIYQHQLTTAITKSNTQKMTVVMERTWSRV